MSQNELKPRNILAIGAHPDDIEVIAGGAIAGWSKAGATVTMVVCTDGSKGSHTATSTQAVADTRRAETQTAASILGVSQVISLDFEDGALESTLELKEKLVEIIRQTKPDTVVTFDPTMVYSVPYQLVNHADHRAAGLAAVDAVYPLARDHLAFPDQVKAGHTPHKVTHLLLSNFNECNYYVDVSDTWHQKIEALAAHKSQFEKIDDIAENLKKIAKDMGKNSSQELAEGFIHLELV